MSDISLMECVVDNVRESLSQLISLQDLLGVSSSDAALLSIYDIAASNNGKENAPRVVIDGDRLEMPPSGGGSAYVHMVVQVAAPDTMSYRDGGVWARQKIGSIETELRRQSRLVLGTVSSTFPIALEKDEQPESQSGQIWESLIELEVIVQS